MTGKCKCSMFTKNIFQETHRFFIASLANVGYSSFLAFHQSREFLSAPKGSFRYLLQQLRNSFADVKISKPGELIHLALSITIIVRFVYVKQSSFQLVQHCLWQHPPPLSASPARLSACTSTPPCRSCCSPWGPQELPHSSLRCVWCQNDSDLDFSSSSEYRASTKPCRASSLFKILD